MTSSSVRFDLDDRTVESVNEGQFSAWTIDSSAVTALSPVAESIGDHREGSPATPTGELLPTAAPSPAAYNFLATESGVEQQEEITVTPTAETADQPDEEDLPTTNPVLTVTPILEHPSDSDPSQIPLDLDESIVESPGPDHLSAGTIGPSSVTAEFLAAQSILDRPEGPPATPTGDLPPTPDLSPATPDSMSTEIDLEQPEERPVTPTDERTMAAAPLPVTPDSLATDSIAG
jgi:hypothetical protein